MADTQVLIVGAGPVGLTLAVDLGRRGVRCTLIEQKEAPQFLPKMERCNARTMEIYRRMGIAERSPRRRPAPPTCRWTSIIVLVDERAAAAAPALSVGRRGARRDRATQRRHAAARALSAHLAIHARAAAEIGRRDAAERHRALRLRVRVVRRRTRRRHRDRAHRRRRDRDDSRAATSSAATAARARCASSSASRCAAKAICWSCARRSYRCDELFDKIPIGNGPGRPPLPRRRRPARRS